MLTVRRAAAWVAWAEWTCSIAPLQATPAIAGNGLKESGLRPALFFAGLIEAKELMAMSGSLR